MALEVATDCSSLPSPILGRLFTEYRSESSLIPPPRGLSLLYKFRSSSSPSASSGLLSLIGTLEEDGGLKGHEERAEEVMGSLAWMETG